MVRIQPQNEGDNYICAKMNRKSIGFFDYLL